MNFEVEVFNPVVGGKDDAIAAMDELREFFEFFGEVNLCEYYDVLNAGKLAEEAAELYGGRRAIYWDNIDKMRAVGVLGFGKNRLYTIKMPEPKVRAVEDAKVHQKLKLKDNRRKKMVRFKDLETKSTFIMVDYLCMKLDNGDAVNLEDGHLYAVSEGKSTLTPDTLVEPVSATISFK